MNTEKLKHHFMTLDRSLFLDDSHKPEAGLDIPLPIGYGQTISQPTLVLEMTILLDPDTTSKVLEIGTGSGYQTALLSPFARTVFTVERIPDLSQQAQRRLDSLNMRNIRYRISDGSQGWVEEAPFDRIIVTAGASEIPLELLDQLALGGKMVIPVGQAYHQRLTLIKKHLDGSLQYEDAGGVVFVELVGKYGWKRP